jgi:hypothetical protein
MTYLSELIFCNVIIFICLLTERLEREIKQYTFIVMWIQCNIASLIQHVPLGTERGFSLITLTPMKILQRNLNRSTFVV